VFFVIVLALHYSPFPWKVKKVNLLLASYLFYAVWNPPFIILLWLSTVVDYLMAALMGREQRPLQRKAYLIVSLILNLGMLAYFKYGAFLLDNFVMLMSGIGVDFHPAAPDIILPVGISFYTFCTLSYTIDVYRRDIPPEKSFLDFALFVTFFPHLVAGPILRPWQLIPQFKKPHYATKDQFAWGIGLMILGLFMKVVVADNLLAPTADLIFGLPMPLYPLDAWTGVLAFSGQIFCDFAGYSTCAIGVAYCLGFTLVENFNYPYAAAGFSDFWRRWHISLSTWLRDYLYLPLGGNRMGAARTYVNLMITMLLGGLWHGASWTFVVWGGLHGTYLIVERLLTRRTKMQTELEPVPVVAQSTWLPGLTLKSARLVGGMLLTFFLINITWVFFRANDFGSAGRLLASMFGLIPNGATMLGTHDIVKVLVTMGVLVLIHWTMRDTKMEDWLSRTPKWAVVILWTVMFVSLILSQQTGDSFIYFQF
jgi:D-alanyl-lipoteichoic acid acyltransferase DltB (MBOAT superfamily)